jgi:hypothetical protein
MEFSRLSDQCRDSRRQDSKDISNGGSMNQDHIDHANSIAEEFTKLMLAKYEKGTIEHGGNLWEKENLLDEAINEAIDQVVYLLTLKQQNERA